MRRGFWGDCLRLVAGATVLLALWIYRVARCFVAGMALATLCGAVWAVLIVSLALLFRLTLLVRVAAGLGLMLLWHWPWWAAVLAVFPRVVLLLPGYLKAWGSRWRHPRPRWTRPAAGP